MIKTNENERREFFRIEDEVYLEYEVISEEEYNTAPDTLSNLNNSSFSLSADFATLNNNIHPVLNNIKQLHPEIGEYLEFINTKIDSLSQLLLCNETSFDENRVTLANISASGIMFETDKPLENNQLLKLELVLLPEKIGILIFGKVVKVNTLKEKNSVSVEFEHIRYEDQELMIKHNLNKQMSDLREKNDNN